MCEFLGYREDELTTLTWRDVTHPEDVEADAEHVRRLLAGDVRSFQMEKRYVRRDGGVVWGLLCSSLVTDASGDPLYGIAQVQDVTAQRREQDLLQSRVTTLSELATLHATERPLDEVLARIAGAAPATTSARSCVVQAGSHRAAAGEAPGGAYEHAWPIVARGTVLGTLVVRSDRPDLPPDDRLQLQALGAQAAVAVENARLLAEARASAALDERRRLSRELHDSVSQALYGIALGVQTARTLLPADPGRAREPLDFAVGLTDAAIVEMRALVLALRPEALDEEGVVATLRHHAEALSARHAMHVDLDVGDEPDATPAVREALYRIAHEALHNAVKHSGARRSLLRLHGEGPVVRLVVTDDGCGFDPAAVGPGRIGLRSMRERAESLGGTFVVRAGPGGTSVEASIPRDAGDGTG